MTAVSITYILMADEGLCLFASISYPCGVLAAAGLLALFAVEWRKEIALLPEKRNGGGCSNGAAPHLGA